MAVILVNPFYVSGGGGGSSTLLTNLVSWWDLSANGNDSHGSNNLSARGTPTYGTVGGYSAVTTSLTSHLYNASPTGVSLSTFTIAAWVYITTTANNSIVLICGDGTNDANRKYQLEANNVKLTARVSNGSGNTIADTGAATLSASTWTLLIADYDDSTGALNCYIDDGTSNGSASTGGSYINASSFGWGIGGDGDGTGNGAETQGAIKSAAVWSRVLTSDERTELYNSGVPLVYADL